MAGPGAALAKSEPTVEELDRFASEIKASWDLDDAPFAAGPAPSAKDLAVLQPLPMEQAQLQELEPPAKSISSPPPAPPMMAPTPAPQQRPVQAVEAVQVQAVQAVQPPPPAPAFAIAPRPAPSVGSLSDLTGSFVVPKKRSGLWVGIGLVALAGIGAIVLLGSPDAPPPTTTKAAEPQAPRDNPIPPPPSVDELPAPKLDKPSGKSEPAAARTPEAPAPAAKPEPRGAPKAEARSPEPKPQPRAATPKPPPPAVAPPPVSKPPTTKSGGGGIVRDVPF